MSQSRGPESGMLSFFSDSKDENDFLNLYESPKKLTPARVFGNNFSPFTFSEPKEKTTLPPKPSAKFTEPLPQPYLPVFSSYSASVSETAASETESLSTSSLSSAQYGDSPLTEDYFISPSLITINRNAELGKGASASVYKGQYQGREVAIKVMSLGKRITQNRSEKEAKILATLMSAASYVVNFLGYCYDKDQKPTECMFVLEYMNQGSLQDWIENTKTSFFLKQKERRTLMRQIAQGTNAVHMQNIVICDAKSENILLHRAADGTLEVKLADFGLAVPESLIPKMTSNSGTPHYMAPEVITNYFIDAKHSKNSKAADIYGIVTVFLEIIKKERIASYYAIELQLKTLEKFVNWHKKGNKPAIPQDTEICPPKLGKLLQQGFFSNPARRPNANELVNTMLEIESDDALAEFKQSDEYKSLLAYK